VTTNFRRTATARRARVPFPHSNTTVRTTRRRNRSNRRRGGTAAGRRHGRNVSTTNTAVRSVATVRGEILNREETFSRGSVGVEPTQCRDVAHTIETRTTHVVFVKTSDRRFRVENNSPLEPSPARQVTFQRARADVEFHSALVVVVECVRRVLRSTTGRVSFSNVTAVANVYPTVFSTIHRIVLLSSDTRPSEINNRYVIRIVQQNVKTLSNIICVYMLSIRRAAESTPSLSI